VFLEKTWRLKNQRQEEWRFVCCGWWHVIFKQLRRLVVFLLLFLACFGGLLFLFVCCKHYWRLCGYLRLAHFVLVKTKWDWWSTWLLYYVIPIVLTVDLKFKVWSLGANPLNGSPLGLIVVYDLLLWLLNRPLQNKPTNSSLKIYRLEDWKICLNFLTNYF